ncbi:hypothetical protein [Phenylobacterium sp.]|uniref:hypothetical protein n=1 Tax=Phenylobacterium sp. TaxID=1871053 RepID=UPI00356A6DD0
MKFNRGLVKLLAGPGIVVAVVIAALGLATDVRPPGLLAGWLVAGLTDYTWTWTRPRPPAAEGA